MTDALKDRLISLALGLPAWVVLGIAVYLEPETKGFGTHQQLGLGGCTVLTMSGYPCPMCGMTTTFTHMAHLSPWMALKTQPFGVVLFLGTLATAMVALTEGLFPRGRWRRIWAFTGQYENRIALALLAGLLAGWIYKIAIMT